MDKFKPVFLVIMTVMLFPGQSRAVTIGELLDMAARQPGYEVSALSVQESELQKQRTTAALFPKLGIFGRFESYNSPTNLRPMAPTEINVQSGEAIPFSRNILRYGLSIDVPVYVHELYVLRQKALLLQQKAETERQLDLVGRQAAIVSLNSALTYLQSLEAAVDARHASLVKTLEDMTLKVKIGRSSESELVKIQKSLNDLDRQRNELMIKQLDTLREIHSLTGLNLTGPVPMALAQKPRKTSFLPVAAAQRNADAARKEVARRRAARFPTLSVTGFLSGNDGEAYNTGSRIYRSYNEIALVLKFPLFDPTLGTDEAIARVQLEKAQKKLEQTQLDMAALADTLDREIPILETSIDLAEQSVSDSRTLLEVSRVALRTGRMTLEDYLRYESDVLTAQSMLYLAQQQWWQVLSRQAALYGTDLTGVIK
ncbi:MAG: TolC family protein [Desulfotignum sp.]